jgi:hypothetical protein
MLRLEIQVVNSEVVTVFYSIQKLKKGVANGIIVKSPP